MKSPLISVIIAVKNNRATLGKCLDSVLAIDYDNYETIVVDDGSTDGTSEALKKYSSKIKIITNTESTGPSAARNSAAHQAEGEFLAFTDGDCIVGSQWLKELLSGFDKADPASVGGRQELPEDAGDFQKKVFLLMKKIGFITDYMRAGKDTIAEVAHNASCCVMYRKEVFLEMGGFLKGFWPGEDVELDYRLKKKGYRLRYNPKALVYHYRPDNLKKFSRMMSRYGRAQGFLLRKYGIFRKIQLVPFLSLGILSALFLYGNFIYLILLVSLVLSWVYLGSFFVLLLCIRAVIFWHLGFITGLFKNESPDS